MQSAFRLTIVVAVLVIGWLPAAHGQARDTGTASAVAPAPVHRSPVDLVLGPAGDWLVTANQTSNSASLVRTSDGAVLSEVPVGTRPAFIALCPDGHRVLISGSESGTVTVLAVEDDRLATLASIDVGFQPHGIAVAADGKTAYVALTAADEVAMIDLETYEKSSSIPVGRWPRYLAISPDGTRLAVGTSGDRGVSVVDTAARKLLYVERFLGLNIGHMQVSSDGKYAYFPWMVYRRNPISPENIRLGWVLASRIARVRLDGPSRREAISLDPQGEAVADPHGLALTPDEKHLVVSASGTHELLVFRATDLPFKDHGGTDHIDPELHKDPERFYRIPLGGRPMGLRISGDGRTVYVANYLTDSVQVVDLDARQMVREMSLGETPAPTDARRGEALFYDARVSLDQWYSCHSCHYEGGTNAVTMDTLNDGTRFTFKTVLPLFNVSETPPWTWHGWQTDLSAAVRTSMTTTMQGKEPDKEDVSALVAFLQSQKPLGNPYRGPDGEMSDAAKRGEQIFRSETAGCTVCHSGPNLTDGLVHDVGSGKDNDRYEGFNTPSLVGVYQKVQLLHDGRADTLGKLLQGPHNPADVTGLGELNDSERRDLVEYLKSL